MFPIWSESIFGPACKYDLYGPIWTVLTLNIMIFIFGNMAAWFYAFLDDDDDFTTDALKIISSTSFLSFYFVFVPLFLWGLIKFTGSGRDDPEYFFLVSVYGYSFVPFLLANVMYSYSEMSSSIDVWRNVSCVSSKGVVRKGSSMFKRNSCHKTLNGHPCDASHLHPHF